MACGVPRKLIKTELWVIGHDLQLLQCPKCGSQIRLAKRWQGWPWKFKRATEHERSPSDDSD
jgi:hypothetical protein